MKLEAIVVVQLERGREGAAELRSAELRLRPQRPASVPASYAITFIKSTLPIFAHSLPPSSSVAKVEFGTCDVGSR